MNIWLSSSPVRNEWIIEGEPEARSAVISTSADGQAFTVVWECSPGIFRWHYDYDETIHFIEGSVTFDDGKGTTRTVGAGEVVYFPKGSSVIWNVHARVRKLAVCRKSLPAPVVATIRVLRRLKAAFGRTKSGATALDSLIVQSGHRGQSFGLGSHQPDLLYRPLRASRRPSSVSARL